MKNVFFFFFKEWVCTEGALVNYGHVGLRQALSPLAKPFPKNIFVKIFIKVNGLMMLS